jgi:hypothetical protein
MRSEKSDENGIHPKFKLHYQAKCVALNIEYYPVIPDNACSRIIPFQIVEILPCAFAYFIVPGTQSLFRLPILFFAPYLAEAGFGDDAHDLNIHESSLFGNYAVIASIKPGLGGLMGNFYF